MTTKLISFIGQGKLDRDSGGEVYLRTAYDFGEGRIIETAVFFDALMSSGIYEMDECLLIGTNTSSWATLLDRDFAGEGKYGDLYERLEVKREHGVSEDILQDLSAALTEIWDVPIRCCAHPAEINEKNASAVVMQYLSEIAASKPDRVIADITHGFRSMPVMLMTALHFREALAINQTDVSVIYGEFHKDQPSPVRKLDAIWDGVHISQAVRLFFEKFEGAQLAQLLHESWPRGAKAVEALGSAIQANYVTRIDETLAQLKNALNKPPENPAPWVRPVVAALEDFHQSLTSDPRRYRRILKVSELLADRYLYGQAVTTLQLALEAFVFAYYEDEERYGQYEATQELRQRFFNKALTKKEKQRCTALNAARNVIAHGGLLSPRGGVPQHQSLPKQYKAYHDNLLEIFERRDG